MDMEINMSESDSTQIQQEQQQNDSAMDTARATVALCSGVLFAFGLVISGMANPEKVIAFLDLSRISQGSWDPALMMVMVGALAVYLPLFHLVIKPRSQSDKSPILDQCYYLPTKNKVDKPLIIGAGLFGIGWGLAGICPGPALVNMGQFNGEMMLFIVAMILGSYLGNKMKN